MGGDTIEIHTDSIMLGERVAIIDDILATGETAKAVASLVEELDGEVAAFVFFSELETLKGRKKLNAYKVYSLIKQ